MRRLPHVLALLCALTLLVACGGGIRGGDLPERVWPPQASLQELRVLPDGRWQLTVRLTNFSTVPVRYGSLRLTPALEEQPAGEVTLNVDVMMAPRTAEPFEVVLAPDAQATARLTAALAAGRGIRYALTGEIRSLEPRRSWPQTFEGVLTPVPGLAGVLR